MHIVEWSLEQMSTLRELYEDVEHSGIDGMGQFTGFPPAEAPSPSLIAPPDATVGGDMDLGDEAH